MNAAALMAAAYVGIVEGEREPFGRAPAWAVRKARTQIPAIFEPDMLGVVAWLPGDILTDDEGYSVAQEACSEFNRQVDGHGDQAPWAKVKSEQMYAARDEALSARKRDAKYGVLAASLQSLGDDYGFRNAGLTVRATFATRQ